MSGTEAGRDGDSFIAVIGMAGRFPGADSVEALWANLCAGTESLSRLPDAPGDEAVAAYGILERADEFDAEFFGYSPADALIMDPQQRVFLECAHEALERAGYAATAGRGSVGVFAGGSTTDYRAAVEANLDRLPFVDRWQVRLATAPDFLATRAAHKLGLTGPAVTVQTACSTSLVAVHLACQALLAGDCQLALAGGAAVHVPHPRVSYTEGGIISPDGHCRAFDAAAAGTVGGSAVAVVVLKPLPDALADGDHVHAVLLGSAANNDGGGGIGFTAPSVDGQAQVIRAAQVVAGVDAGTIGYVEAHGTGTSLGDPVEVAALTSAFRASTDRCGYCALGSVKSNLGHTDAAAGVTGLVKAVLAVEHGLVPPSLHVTRPNPRVDWDSSPFVVSTSLTSWPLPGPRRAGVSSLGVGGTNAHVVLEQPPPRPRPRPSDTPQVLVRSAATPAALAEADRRLAGYLDREPDADLGDVAWTLQVGRQAHRYRRFLTAATAAQAAAALRADPPDGDGAGHGEAGTAPQVVFMFAGQGGQHVGMARHLYQRVARFRAGLDECAELAAPALGLDLREVLFPGAGPARARAADRLGTIAVGQPAVFAVEYALAQLLLDWGVRPRAVVGHSLGAFAAATVAGVMSLPEAVGVVVRRGRLLQSLPAGAMVGVGLSESDIGPLLPQGLSVAAVNGPRRCAVAGPAGPVRAFAEWLRGRDVEARVLPIATAGHSPLVDPIVAEFRAVMDQVALHPATVPFLSDTTGRWAEPRHPATGEYWATHLREPVQFSRALATLFDEPGPLGTGPRVLVEVGPGRTLATLARQHPLLGRHRAVPTLPHPLDDTSDLATLLAAVGQLWVAGATIDWPRLHAGQHRRRVVLPTYPFQRRRYLVPPDGRTAPAPADLVIGAGSPAAGGPAVAPPARPPDQHGPESSVEAAVRAAFAQALGLPGVSARDDLFQLGGDSLTATRLAAWVRRRFAAPVRAADVVRARTPAACARLVEERTGQGGGVPAGRRPPGAPERTPWLSRRSRVAGPRYRLYCFPHSGGAAGEYLRWADALPRVEVWGINLPGRGSRYDEPPLGSMGELAAAVAAGVTFIEPFVLFGHSFGALLAYHVAQELRGRGGARPAQLVLSGYPPPHQPRELAPISALPDDEFLRRLDEYHAGVPAELHDNPELAALTLPAYRADLAILERYQDQRLPPLACPLVVVVGDGDRYPVEQMGQWRRHTTAGCRVHQVPGGHFYFRRRPEPLYELLRDLVPGPATAVGPS
jgi:acyl transferase domain-containing protein/thioesterase domain-containing protein